MKRHSIKQRRLVKALLPLLLSFALFISALGQAFPALAEELMESAAIGEPIQSDSQEDKQDDSASDSTVTASTYALTGDPGVSLTFLSATSDQLLVDVQAAIEGAAQSVQSLSKIGDWQAVGLSKAGKPIPSSYLTDLYRNLVAKKGIFTLVTDYERTVIGLTAAHQDATKFAGYNLVERIYNSEKMESQGLNGPLYALIALDSGQYAIPEDALWTRDKLAAAVVAKQKADGGFALGSGVSDPDITAMAITALAPYYSQANVQAAVDQAVNWLSVNQQANGGYLSWGADASESVSQAIIALSSLGIDPTESRFTKNDVNLVQKLLSFRKSDGTFSHTPTGNSNGMATEQALQALIAFAEFNGGGSRLYDFGKPQTYGWASHWILEASWFDTEWQAIAVSRAGHEVPPSYLANLPTLAFIKDYPEYAYVTDYERLAMALTALRQDAADYDGINIVERIYNSAVMEAQGINGLAFALIALDSGEYATPADALWNRDKLLNAILDKQNPDGGFALSTGDSDPDLTAMTLTALAPYRDRAEVETAGQRAVQWLSNNQQANGGYLSAGVDSSEGVSQAIIALTSNGIDPTSAAFTKNGITLLDKLFAYYQPDGGFSHVIDPQAASDAMATEQALQALTAYEMFVQEKGRLYEMGKPIRTVSLQVEGPSGLIAEGSASGSNVLEALEQLLEEKQIPIDVTDSSFGKYVSAINGIEAGTFGGYDGWMYDVYRDGRWSFPLVSVDAFELNPSDKIVVYYAGDNTQLVESIQIVPAVPVEGKSFTVDVKKTASVWNGSASEIVTSPAAGVKVMINGASAVTDANGLATFSNGIAEAGTYAIEITGYEAGHAPTIVRATQPIVIAEAPSTPPGNGGGPGGPTGPTGPTTNYITLSVTGDSAKGTILADKQVALQAGDTAYTVLARELPGKIRSIGSGATLYVQGIDGLSEFDRGPDSGWMYAVNGVFPNYSAGIYTLKANDTVAWRYTTNLGKDLGQDPDEQGAPGGSGPGGVQPASPSVIDVPKDLKQDYEHKLTADNAVPVTLRIPDVPHKIVLNIEAAKDGLPKLTASKDNLIFEIEKDTKLVSGSGSIELFTAIDAMDANLQELVGSGLSGSPTVLIRQAFVMGAADQSYLFDKPLTLTIRGGKGQQAGYIEGSTYTPIAVYASEQLGKEATKNDKKVTYAYVVDDDLVIKTNHFTTFITYTATTEEQTVREPGKTYSDAHLIAAWAKEAIERATEKGFVQGSGGRLNPKSAVTRAEFTKLMVAVLGLPTAAAATHPYEDVPAQAWYSPYVQAAHQAGIIQGFGSAFKPNETITREQMAVMVVRSLGLDPASEATSLNDLHQASPWALSAVQTSLAAQLMNGEGASFNPSGTVTREMAAVVAMRAHDYEASSPEPAYEAVESKLQAVKGQIASTGAYLQQTVKSPAVSTLGGEWTVLGLARSGLQVPEAYYASYYANLEQTLKEKSGNLHNVKYTEYDRVILALTALGKRVDDVAGYNLLEKLADYDALTKQGINGPIFALIALDSKPYAVPIVPGVKTQTTRELLVAFILNRQLDEGGWALGENPTEADPDVTAMAIQALAPYYVGHQDVKSAVDEAVGWLSANQQASGGFASNKAVNAESVAQVVVALTGLGIDPHSDPRFVKNGHSAIEALLSYAAADGGFYHIKAGDAGNGGATPGEADPMAADQAMYALVAYERMLNGQTRLYDMSDVKNAE